VIRFRCQERCSFQPEITTDALVVDYVVQYSLDGRQWTDAPEYMPRPSEMPTVDCQGFLRDEPEIDILDISQWAFI